MSDFARARARRPILRNDDAGSGCGYEFEKGTEYVIFATRNELGEIQIAWFVMGEQVIAAAEPHLVNRPRRKGRKPQE